MEAVMDCLRYLGVYVEVVRNAAKILVRMADLQARIYTRYLAKAKQ
jgi:hypothetical protein